jgi:hypothetical protein
MAVSTCPLLPSAGWSATKERWRHIRALQIAARLTFPIYALRVSRCNTIPTAKGERRLPQRSKDRRFLAMHCDGAHT